MTVRYRRRRPDDVRLRDRLVALYGWSDLVCTDPRNGEVERHLRRHVDIAALQRDAMAEVDVDGRGGDREIRSDGLQRLDAAVEDLLDRARAEDDEELR